MPNQKTTHLLFKNWWSVFDMLIFTSFPKEINGNEIQNLFKTGGEKR